MATIPHAAGATAGGYTVGTLIAGKYRLEAPIATGGMGAVWIARHEVLDATVALKLILPELRAVETAQRLLMEARVEAKLNHPGIVRVFDYGQTVHGDYFIVMELLVGADLGHILAKHSRLSATTAVQILLPIAEALCFAHEHGVIHRDLKPNNIFLTGEGSNIQPKLVDFGIAKYHGELDGMHVTTGGTVLGCPAYMTPERARGESTVEPGVDVWSLCVVLYEVVSGSVPFSGRTYGDVLRAVVHDEVQPLLDAGNGEGDLWSILARGLAKEPSLRIRTASELGVALADWLVGRGVAHDITGASVALRWRRVPTARRAESMPRPPRLRAAPVHAPRTSSVALRVPKHRAHFGVAISALCVLAAGLAWLHVGAQARREPRVTAPEATALAFEPPSAEAALPPVPALAPAPASSSVPASVSAPAPAPAVEQVSSTAPRAPARRPQRERARRASLAALDLKEPY